MIHHRALLFFRGGGRLTALRTGFGAGSGGGAAGFLNICVYSLGPAGTASDPESATGGGGTARM